MAKRKIKLDSAQEARIANAIQALEDDKSLSLRAASVRFGIPRTTLRNRQLENTKPRNKAHEEQQVFTEEEESEIEQWVQQLDDIGIPPRVSHVYEMARRITKHQNTNATKIIGEHWITRFLDRHPDIACKFACRINHEREAATQPAAIKSFFDRLSEVKSRYRIQPNDTWNTDEKGFMIGVAKCGQVLCRAQRRNPRIRHPGN